ncbi:phage regulatory CII family protein [Candidatus Endoriftia persephonae]|nr:phage regulatory CII family protein [Candidatus Endoriftia persephone]USF88764.1 hypothetical protein L0Y14_05895 [Candidatus Endoriftia persephone]
MLREIPSHWTPVQEAAWRTVHEFRKGMKGGAEALGPMLGKSAGTLSNEVNPESSSHKLGLEDAIILQLMAQDYRLLHAFSHTLHHISIQLPDAEPVGDVELLDKFSAWQAKMGCTCEVIHQSLADHRVTLTEARAIKTAGYRHIQAFLEFLSRIEQLAEAEDARRTILA